MYVPKGHKTVQKRTQFLSFICYTQHLGPPLEGQRCTGIMLSRYHTGFCIAWEMNFCWTILMLSNCQPLLEEKTIIYSGKTGRWFEAARAAALIWKVLELRLGLQNDNKKIPKKMMTSFWSNEIIFHRTRFPWNKGSHFPSKTLPFGGPGRVRSL